MLTALFQLAHHLVSASVEVRSGIGSHLGAGDPFDPSRGSAVNAARKAEEIIGLLGLRVSSRCAPAPTPRSAPPLASGCLLEPPIADRLVAVWMGGPNTQT
jgi:hypothetical protein